MLTALGIGAVIGTGIFVVTGQAAAEHAGPAVLISFMLAAICCGFTALCYAEFATLIPISGSSYSYAYATLGEMVAWFIGWNMVLEYGISASAVAVSWTGYFTSLLDNIGIHLPQALTEAPLAYTNGHLVSDWTLDQPARRGDRGRAHLALLRRHSRVDRPQPADGGAQGRPDHRGGGGWLSLRRSGQLASVHSARKGPANMAGPASCAAPRMVFFAYIGFEATSTAAQECKESAKGLADRHARCRLVICTVLYMAMAAVLTGLISYTQLGTSEPVVTAIRVHPELGWLRWIVEIGALIGLSSVILVMIIAQPRIFMVMSRDGLLPPVFGRIHSRHRTPHINTLITGTGIAILAAIFPLDLLADLTSMGTLIAFVAVCSGVLILRYTAPHLQRGFRVPWAWVICPAGVLSCLALLYFMDWFNWVLMIAWTVGGLAIYFGYGIRHSRLRAQLNR